MAFLSHIRKQIRRHPFLAGILVILILLATINIAVSLMLNNRGNRKTPYDYPGSIWESIDPTIRLEVGRLPGEEIDGTVILNGEARRVVLELTAGSGAELWDYEKLQEALKLGGTVSEGMVLVKGVWSFNETEIIIKIEKDNIYGNQYHKIILTRLN